MARSQTYDLTSISGPSRFSRHVAKHTVQSVPVCLKPSIWSPWLLHHNVSALSSHR